MTEYARTVPRGVVVLRDESVIERPQQVELGNLAPRQRMQPGRAAGPDFGRALEHFVLMELLAYRSYRECDYEVRFWRTKAGLECDFVLGREGEVAIEVKGSANPGPGDLRALRAYVRDHRPRLAAVVCNASAPRRTPDGIDILPWDVFLERLWADAIIT
jgi:predicted AAA+ superfamily ATPase